MTQILSPSLEQRHRWFVPSAVQHSEYADMSVTHAAPLFSPWWSTIWVVSKNLWQMKMEWRRWGLPEKPALLFKYHCHHHLCSMYTITCLLVCISLPVCVFLSLHSRVDSIVWGLARCRCVQPLIGSQGVKSFCGGTCTRITLHSQRMVRQEISILS